MENLSPAEIASISLFALFLVSLFFNLLMSSKVKSLSTRLDREKEKNEKLSNENVSHCFDAQKKHERIGRLKAEKTEAESKFERFVACVKENANFRNGKLMLPKGTIPQPICDHFDISSTPKK